MEPSSPAFLGFIDESGQLSWASAGHGPMLFCATAGGEPLELESTGLPLGVSDDWFGDENVPVLQLHPGGWLAVISDGIFEAFNPADEQFQSDRVKQILLDRPHAKCDEMVTALREAVRHWQTKDEPADDQTIVIIRHVPASADVSPAIADSALSAPSV